jgi:hypothetical protein
MPGCNMRDTISWAHSSFASGIARLRSSSNSPTVLLRARSSIYPVDPRYSIWLNYIIKSSFHAEVQAAVADAQYADPKEMTVVATAVPHAPFAQSRMPYSKLTF